MSILDFFINIITWFLNNTIGRLPENFSGFSLADFSSSFSQNINAFSSAFNFIEMFFPLKLLFIFLGVVIVAEIMLHFGFKAIKYVVNVLRGSGG